MRNVSASGVISGTISVAVIPAALLANGVQSTRTAASNPVIALITFDSFSLCPASLSQLNFSSAGIADSSSYLLCSSINVTLISDTLSFPTSTFNCFFIANAMSTKLIPTSCEPPESIETKNLLMCHAWIIFFFSVSSLTYT